jgi:hypothetical protein
MPKGVPNKQCAPESKVVVVETMRKVRLNCREAVGQSEVPSDTRIVSGKRICLTEGFQREGRGRGNKGRMAKLQVRHPSGSSLSCVRNRLPL